MIQPYICFIILVYLDTKNFNIEILHSDGYKLIEQLEKLKIINIIPRKVKVSKKRISQKYRGVLTAEQSKKLKEHSKKSRNEW
jgi:Spy/CpxP family protein refolding chaperone